MKSFRLCARASALARSFLRLSFGGSSGGDKMVFAFIPFLLAQVVCVDNGDGSWTCTGSGIPGVTTNEQGQASCTNCVNMSPADCMAKRNSLLTDLSNLDNDLQSLIVFAEDQGGFVQLMAEDFRGFTDYPYPYYGSTYSVSNLQSFLASVTGSSSNTSSNREAAVNKLVSEYNDSDNSDYTGDYYMPSSFSANNAWATHQGVYGFWHASYMVGHQVAPALDRASHALFECADRAHYMHLDVISLLSTAESINCAPCVLGGGDDGGGSGTQVGCLECYLVFLRRYSEQLDLLNVQVSSLTNIQMRILSEVKDINSILPSISNHVGRIDDYLWTDQSNMLANVEAAIIVISNNVDTIQQYYFHTFSNASDISRGVYGSDANGHEFTMEEVFNRIFKARDQGGFQLSEYEKYDWFRRIELQLSQISGIFSETNVDSISDSEYDNMKTKVDEFEDLADSASSAGSSVLSVGEAVKNAVRSVGGIFPSSAPPGEIKLLDKQYWFADTDLVLRTDYQVVSFCRALFGLIWTVLAVVGFWILLSRSWVVLFDIARWFCNWFPKIFGN